MLGKVDVRPDPILTNIAMEYGTGGGFAYEQAVPLRRVSSRDFKYAKWDLGKYTSDFMETLRAPGDPAKKAIDPSITWSTGHVLTHAQKTDIPDELRAEAPNPAALERAKVQRMVWSLRRAKELAFRDLITDTGTISNATPAVKWDAAAAVVIEANIDAAKEAFLLNCGFEANTIILPPAVSKVVKRDSTIRELIKYTTDDLLINGDLPPTIFGLRVVIPGGVVNSSAAAVATSLARIWSTDKAILLYVNPAAESDPEAMTVVMEFGADYAPGGSAYPVITWRDADQSSKKTWYSVENAWDMELVAGCAYIINDVLT